MIEFTTIEIQDFYSIEYLKYSFKTGIHKLSGKNGVGKTSISSAIAQCLYNKNPKATSTLDSTYNYVTNRPYKITVTFKKDDSTYKIINDRTTNSISIFKDEAPITSKGIKAQLANIAKIIGLDYDTFVSITYLNQNSMKSVFDLTDSNNLVNKFFDLSLIKYLDKQLKATRRDSRKHLAFLSAQLQDITKTVEALDKYKEEDTAVYKAQIEEKKAALADTISGELYRKLDSLENIIKTQNSKLIILKEPILLKEGEINVYKKQIKQLSKGICPLCNSSVKDVTIRAKAAMELAERDIKAYKEEYLSKKRTADSTKEAYNKLKEKYNKAVRDLKDSISLLNNKVLVIEEKNTQLKSIQKDKELLIEKKNNLKETINDKENELLFIESALGVIASGSIIKQYINSFITVLNSKLNGMAEILDLNLKVVVSEEEGNIIYNISNNGISTLFSSLSSGEKTRVSLLVLLAIVETLEVLTNISVNVLIFDELLAVLDTEGVKLFQEQLNMYRDKKNVLVVIHHDEIPDDYFDSILRVYKRNNLTKLEEIV